MSDLIERVKTVLKFKKEKIDDAWSSKAIYQDGALDEHARTAKLVAALVECATILAALGSVGDGRSATFMSSHDQLMHFKRCATELNDTLRAALEEMEKEK